MNFWTNVAGNIVVHIYNLEQIRQRSEIHLARTIHRSESHTPKCIPPPGNWLFMFSCLHSFVFMHVYTCVGACAHGWECMWRSEVHVRNHPQLLFTSFFEVKSFIQAHSLPIWLVLLARLFWGSSVFWGNGRGVMPIWNLCRFWGSKL